MVGEKKMKKTRIGIYCILFLIVISVGMSLGLYENIKFGYPSAPPIYLHIFMLLLIIFCLIISIEQQVKHKWHMV